MKEGLFDKVVDRLNLRRQTIKQKLAKDYKRVMPFRSQLIPKQEVLDAYAGLSMADMQELVAKHGEEKVNQFIAEMEQLKDKESFNAITKAFNKD